MLNLQDLRETKKGSQMNKHKMKKIIPESEKITQESFQTEEFVTI